MVFEIFLTASVITPNSSGGGWSAPSHIQPTPDPVSSNVAPSPVPAAVQPTPSSSTQPSVQPQDVSRVQKLCKFASSALDYDDSATAIKNLTEALEILNKNQQ